MKRSHTQLSEAGRCPRMHVLRILVKSGRKFGSQRRGLQLHEAYENAINHGLVNAYGMPTDGELSPEEIAPYLDKFAPILAGLKGARAETRYDVLRSGTPFISIVDLQADNRPVFDGDRFTGLFANEPCVIDFKFTSGKKFARDEKQLATYCLATEEPRRHAMFLYFDLEANMTVDHKHFTDEELDKVHDWVQEGCKNLDQLWNEARRSGAKLGPNHPNVVEGVDISVFQRAIDKERCTAIHCNQWTKCVGTDWVN